MISWRYHLITIVAVFLALALGVLAGSTVIKQNLVSGLQAEKAALTAEANKADAAATQANDDLAVLNQAVVPDYLSGRLAGDRVLLVTPDNVDKGTLSQTRTSLTQAGAKIVATLTVNLHGLDSASLATAVGLPSSTPVTQLAMQAAHKLAPRLAEGPITPVQKDDLLYKVLKSGLLYIADNSPIPDTTTLGGPFLRVVIVGSTDPTQSDPPQTDFLDPLIHDLLSHRVAVGVAAPSQSASAFLDPIQQDPNAAQMVTVNDGDTTVGGIALVLGMERLVKFDKGGTYGTGSGGSVSLATPSPPAS